MEIPVSSPSSEERAWGALANASLIFFMFGFIVPAILWSTQRVKSGYVAFQALQALGFQVISYTLGLVLSLLLSLVHLVYILNETDLSREFNGAAGEPLAPLMSTFVIWGIMLAGILVYMGTGIIGAGLNLAGKEFRVPFLGKRLARYLEYRSGSDIEPLNEEREDRWVAAMSHAAVVINLWGMVLPLIVWFMERKRSALLRFQEFQALLFQVITAALLFAALAVYMFSLGLVFAGTLIVSGSSDSGSLLIILILSMVILLIFAAIVLAVPLLHILGQWAALRILQGHDYQYPLLGRRIRSWLDRRVEKQVRRMS
jgi:uncharacterized Tic20 family protein